MLFLFYIALILFSHSVCLRWTFANILDTSMLELRTKRDASCVGVINIAAGGTDSIQLRTELRNDTELYKSNEVCTWSVKTSQGHNMIITSEYFSIRESDDCTRDFVEIRELDFVNSRFCGLNPFTYITTGEEIVIQFESDASHEDRGFKFIIDSVPVSTGDSKCNSSIFGGEDSMISNNYAVGASCFYRIEAPEDKVIELDLKQLHFGSTSCEEESILIYQGLTNQRPPLGEICSDAVNGIQPFYETSVFIEYRNPSGKYGERFLIQYSFVNNTFAPPVTPSTTPFPANGSNDCEIPYDSIYEYTTENDGEIPQGSFVPNGTVLNVRCRIVDIYDQLGDYYDGGDHATVQCIDMRLGTANISCLNETSSEEKIISCNLTNGQVLPRNFSREYDLEVSCNEGYELNLILPEKPYCKCSKADLTCVYGGQTPKCLPVNCEIPEKYDSILYVYYNEATVGLSRGMTVKHGDSVYFKCINSETEHFEPSDTRFECMKGKWVQDATDEEWLKINSSYFPQCRKDIIKYVIQIKTGSDVLAGTSDRVYVNLHGENYSTGPLDVRGLYAKGGLDETVILSIDVTPIRRITVGKYNYGWPGNDWQVDYVSIFVKKEEDNFYVEKDDDQYYVFDVNNTWIKDQAGTEIELSRWPEQCVHIFQRQDDMYPNFSYTNNAFPLHNGHFSERSCKQACVLNREKRCNGVYFPQNGGFSFGQCWGFQDTSIMLFRKSSTKTNYFRRLCLV